VEQPILALGGDHDRDVPPSEIEAWGAQLAGSSVAHEATVLPCITHALNGISEPDALAVTPDDIGDGVDPSVIDALHERVR